MMGRTLENKLSDLYVANFGRLTEGWPAYVNNRRREALENMTLSGVPGCRDEAYRHYDLRGFLDRASLLAGPTGDGDNSFDNVVDGRLAGNNTFRLEDAHHIILDNGICRHQGITGMPDGSFYGSLQIAASSMSQVVEERLDSAVGRHADAVTSLCSVFAEDGAFVYIPAGVKVDKPFHIDIRYRADSDGMACFPRVLVVLEDGASAQLVISYSDTGLHGILSGHLREIVVGEYAKLDITESVSMRPDSVLLSCNYMEQQASSRTSTTAGWLRGGATRINAVTGLAGRDCETSLYGLYLGNGSDLCDIHMKVFHDTPDCCSNEVVKCVVSGEATGAFTGMVYVAPDAQRTAALQQSRNLQLSDTSRIFTEPQLEIYADDVKCSHGATVGQLNEEEIYYMRQRGISEQDARKLQLQGFVNDVISHCASGEACEAVSRLAEARIAEL